MPPVPGKCRGEGGSDKKIVNFRILSADKTPESRTRRTWDGNCAKRAGSTEGRTTDPGDGPGIQLDQPVPGGSSLPCRPGRRAPPGSSLADIRGTLRPSTVRDRQGQDPVPERVSRERAQRRPPFHDGALPPPCRHARSVRRSDPAGTPFVLPLPAAASRGKGGRTDGGTPGAGGGKGNPRPPVQLQGSPVPANRRCERGGAVLKPGGRALAHVAHGGRIGRGGRRGGRRAGRLVAGDGSTGPPPSRRNTSKASGGTKGGDPAIARIRDRGCRGRGSRHRGKGRRNRRRAGVSPYLDRQPYGRRVPRSPRILPRRRREGRPTDPKDLRGHRGRSEHGRVVASPRPGTPGRKHSDEELFRPEGMGSGGKAAAVPDRGGLYRAEPFPASGGALGAGRRPAGRGRREPARGSVLRGGFRRVVPPSQGCRRAAGAPGGGGVRRGVPGTAGRGAEDPSQPDFQEGVPSAQEHPVHPDIGEPERSGKPEAVDPPRDRGGGFRNLDGPVSFTGPFPG